MRIFPAGFVALALACASFVPPAVAQGVEQGACAALRAGPTRTVAGIVDAETLKLDDGTELRLIGALPPRAIDAGLQAGAWAPEVRTQGELGRLLLGKSIELRFGAVTADRYGRLLAHAFLIEGDGRRWVQAGLLEQGLARAYALAGHRACASELLVAEGRAREAHAGLWAEAAYQVRQAHAPAELLRYRATFQVVEGRIERVALVRGVIYLNFDRNWRQAFSVSLRQEDRAMLGDHAARPKGLEGKTVRVHGWIDQRGSAPAIDVSAAGLIELVDAPVTDSKAGR